MPNPPNSIAVVSHDAGGANQIFAFISAGDLEFEKGYFEGPALTLFRNQFPERTLVSEVDLVLYQAKSLITGTGWGSSLEHNARKLAKQRGIFSVAVLDHWTNYKERFEKNGEVVLPNEIWVVDEYAQALAKRTFSHLPIVLKRDCYAEQQLRKVLPTVAIKSNELLYLLEPARSDWNRNEVGELQALRYFLERFQELNLPDDIRIRLRPHPSDPPEKYAEFLSRKCAPRIFIDKGELSEALSRANWVAGCQTYALTLALKAGRTVYGTLPPWAPACVLPHQGIIHLRDLPSR